ncbi:MAG: cupin domain-containing protein [Pedobacter sp.]|nr:MAG: cupin domain-containing protein [Pedobacter sp.]
MKLLKDIPGKKLVPGITGHYAHGTEMTFGLVKVEKGSDLPAHQHPHEQITYIIEGELDMIIGGQPVRLTAGMFHVIPSNVPHGAKASVDCTLIDVFSPVREDYQVQ